jgi:uncharacterized protein YecE (DUF72 family)
MYKHSRGTVYPESLPARRWFEHYTNLFDTVEINDTFSRLPTEHAAEGWAAQAPAGFVYSLKLGLFGSHRMKLTDAESWLPNHLDRVGAAAGATLVQLPPRWRRNVARLDEFLSTAPSDKRWAVELRDPSWLNDETYDVLHRHRAALCIHDLLAGHPWELTADWPTSASRGRTPSTTATKAATEKMVSSGWQIACRPGWPKAFDVYAYFNNDDSGYAIQDASWLARRLAG